MRTYPKIRIKGFTDPWEQSKFGEILKVYPFKPYLAEPCDNGQYEVIQQGNVPVVGYADGSPCYDYEKVTVFGDHTVSLYKTKSPFFVASDGVKILSADNMDGNFLYSLLERYKPKPEGYKRHFSILKEKICFFSPNSEEQLKIGLFFSKLDNLITLHQRKCESLKLVKKSFLEKLFPKDGEKFPELRFKGFTDPWEQRKFVETFDFLPNNSLSRAQLTYENGTVKNVHYGDVLIKFGELLDVGKEELPNLIDDSLIKNYSSAVLKNGDIVIADAAEDETVGKCSEIKGIKDEKILSGLHTIPVRPRFEFENGYLGYFMNSHSYHDQLLPLIQGTKVSSISKKVLENTVISYPASSSEQEKIATFFENLTNLITLHQRKCEALKSAKQFFLQNMFV